MHKCLFEECTNLIKIDKKKFCSKSCYRKARIGYRHSEETKNKIAIGNSKPFTESRKKAISEAKLFKPSDELLEKLKSLWSIGYISDIMIMKKCNLKSRVYARLKQEHCRFEQRKFMPSMWSPEDYEKIISLAKSDMHATNIAKEMSTNRKMILSICKRINCKVRNRKYAEERHINNSRIEKLVCDWLIEAGYDITKQFQLGNFYFDARINDEQILVEVHGDYWHCNRRVYTAGPINEMQRSSLRRDFAKKACAEKSGYVRIIVWEKDIKEKPLVTKQRLIDNIKDAIQRIQPNDIVSV